jgi:hypothetical protein
MEIPPNTLLNRDYRFCEMELEHTQRFLGLSRHFIAMSAAVLLVATSVLTPLLLYATNMFEVLLPIVKVSFLYAV